MDTVIPATLRRSPDDGSPAFAPSASDAPATRPRLRPGGVDRNRRTGRPPLCHGRLRAPALGRLPLQRHCDRRTPARPTASRRSGCTAVPTILCSGLCSATSGRRSPARRPRSTCTSSRPTRRDTAPYASRVRTPADFDMPLSDPKANLVFWPELTSRNRVASTILTQVGAALRAPQEAVTGPFEGWNVTNVDLAGHSQTSSVTTHCIRDATRRSASPRAQSSTTATSPRVSPTIPSTTLTSRSSRS
ncbi:hypothetical protein Franean1_3158 [Parafrankia sp. EAN1pec]|nr:hypothetical protein Franean1_3158 [Frankia sp. EAN1pec]